MKLFLATKPLHSVAMDLLGPLPETELGKKFLLVLDFRFPELTHVVPLEFISTEKVSVAFCNHWVFK